MQALQPGATSGLRRVPWEDNNEKEVTATASGSIASIEGRWSLAEELHAAFCNE
jgi:hypothetical protein